ncbi:MAG TPA: DUF4296 domain-containing protein [Chitinophagaceae bacterium]|nr:DUF4296 domain-containing protein [Chitinophagaceae bacterium]
MRIFLFFLLLIFFSACVRNNKIPKGIITQNEMRKLMWDLVRADAYIADFIMKDSTRDQKAESAILYEQVFTIHSTTADVFKRSLAFYQSRPDLLKVITDSLKSDEKKAQEYRVQDKKLQIDTTFRKIKLDKRLRIDTPFRKMKLDKRAVKTEQ